MICGVCKKFFSASVSNGGNGRICDFRPMTKLHGKPSIDFIKQESACCQDFELATHFYCPIQECFIAVKGCMNRRRNAEEADCQRCEFGRQVVLAIRKCK